MKQNKQKPTRPPIILPLLIILLLTVIAWLTRIDHFMAGIFFNEADKIWFLKHDLIITLIYEATPVPAFIVFGISVIVAITSIWKKTWRKWTRQAICLIVVMALGPGLVVNSIFKDWYGRPRPKQTVEYEGKMEFCPVWIIGHPGEAKSFPCGHASVGFYFMAGYFCWWRKNRRVARRWMAAGLGAGTLLGLARMASGAHWFSDVVWAAAFVYFISYGVAWACGLFKEPTESTL